MLLFVHIFLATNSLLFAGVNLYFPSKAGFLATYISVLGTLSTGVTLLMVQLVNLERSCFSGVVYLGVIGYLSLKAKRTIISVDEKLVAGK